MKYINAERSIIVDGNRSIPAIPGNADYDAIVASGVVVEYYTPPALTAQTYASETQYYVDATAKAKGYADGVALAGYSTSTIPSWASEAATFIAWRDQVWLHAYTELAKVQAGQRAAPTVEGFLAELPAIAWPQS